MSIILKSRREIDLMRRAGSVVAEVLLKFKEVVKPGVTTGELDKIALEMTAQAGAQALFKGVRSPYAKNPFPGAICASVNEQIVHGIPSELVKLNQGDILSVDFGVKLNGYCGDAAVTIEVGSAANEDRRLMEVTKRALDIAIEMAAPSVKWSTIAAEMEKCAKEAGFSVVKEFVGHGIGTSMHEDPKVPNFVDQELLDNDILLEEGMVLAVEPMINAGTYKTKTLSDGWTVVTKDGRKSAHFEHTIAITKKGCEILTLV